MKHWSADFVGKRYSSCALLVQNVAKNVLGRDIVLPNPDTLDTNNPAEIRRVAGEIARRVDTPLEAQPVLLDGWVHIGVTTNVGGIWYILHMATPFKSVVLQKLDDVHMGRVDGFYEWI